MKPLFSRQSTRRTAAAMLFVWLLALATGMANACLLPALAAHGHAPAGFSNPSAPAAGRNEGTPLAQLCGHEDASSHAKAACQNFCAVESLGLVTPQGAKTAPLIDLPVPPPLGASLTVASTPRLALRPGSGAAPSTEAPVPIRFLRLTI